MKNPSPRSSRVAALSFAYALCGWLATIPLIVLFLINTFLLERTPGWFPYTMLFGVLGLLLYALLGALVSAVSGLRVLASRGTVRGMTWVLIGGALNLMIGTPGFLLVSAVGILIGLLATGTIGFGNAGRPLRIGDRVWRGRFFPGAWHRPTEFRPRTAFAWAMSASAERSAIDAFRYIAEDLRVHGAPESLIERCRIASDQERIHTEHCLALVDRFSGLSLVTCNAPAAPRATLEQLAVSSLVDGVIGEGFAAALAAYAEARVLDPEVAKILAVIALDEAEHAELSADILAWCLAHGGASVAQAVAAVRPKPLRAAAVRPIDGGAPIAEQHILYQQVWGSALRSITAKESA